MNYLKNNLKTYINSFKDKRILVILALNTLFVLITIAAIKLIKLISKSWIDRINNISLSNTMIQSEAQLQKTVTTLRGFVLFTIFTVILFILFLIINWSIFQGIIYNILLKKQFNLKHLGNFLLLNIIWFIPWLILFFIIISGSKITYLTTSFYTLILILLHFSFILYILFIKNNELREIKNALKIGITKIHHFIIPYILITITFIILSQLNLLKINYLIIIAIYILFFSWLQNYTKDIILNISET